MSLTGIVSDSLAMNEVMICMGSALLLGLLVACVYMLCGSYHKYFVITLVILPVIVQAVIMMVNGNLGTSVAVLGAFSLIRFRSVPGSSREIASIFWTMAIGLATAMGQILYAVVLSVVIAVVLIILSKSSFGEAKSGEQQLKIVIPESLDYESVFDDLLAEYTTFHELDRVKTTHLGSMYELRYRITMRHPKQQKEMMDAIRCRNGNLTVACGRSEILMDTL